MIAITISVISHIWTKPGDWSYGEIWLLTSLGLIVGALLNTMEGDSGKTSLRWGTLIKIFQYVFTIFLILFASVLYCVTK